MWKSAVLLTILSLTVARVTGSDDALLCTVDGDFSSFTGKPASQVSDCVWDSFACWRDVDITFTRADGTEASCCQQRFEECCKYVMDPEAYVRPEAQQEATTEADDETTTEAATETTTTTEPPHADTLIGCIWQFNGCIETKIRANEPETRCYERFEQCKMIIMGMTPPADSGEAAAAAGDDSQQNDAKPPFRKRPSSPKRKSQNKRRKSQKKNLRKSQKNKKKQAAIQRKKVTQTEKRLPNPGRVNPVLQAIKHKPEEQKKRTEATETVSVDQYPKPLQKHYQHHPLSYVFPAFGQYAPHPHVYNAGVLPKGSYQFHPYHAPGLYPSLPGAQQQQQQPQQVQLWPQQFYHQQAPFIVPGIRSPQKGYYN